MTTWELASEADVRTIRDLLAKAWRAGVVLPPMPGTFDEKDFTRLTQRDAGKAISHLRQALRDADA